MQAAVDHPQPYQLLLVAVPMIPAASTLLLPRYSLVIYAIHNPKTQLSSPAALLPPVLIAVLFLAHHLQPKWQASAD
jgi:hypothetical protein